MKKVFVFDTAICNGCYNCQIACKDEHVANDWTPYAKPQPETGQFWLKLHETVRGYVPKVKVAYRAHLCMHCDNAACIANCPVEGAIYRREDGLVIINPEKCTGCKRCVDSCPYDAIYYNADLNIAQKCTGCAHLLDRGWKEPRCVDACPTLALKMLDESEISNIKEKAEILQPDLKAGPRVYYLNLPKRFIAGTVYDPVEKEVIVGAVCNLVNLDSHEEFTTETDGFGDFWFEGMKEGTFSLKISKDGKYREISSISTEKDVNLGDIPIT